MAAHDRRQLHDDGEAEVQHEELQQERRAANQLDPAGERQPAAVPIRTPVRSRCSTPSATASAIDTRDSTQGDDGRAEQAPADTAAWRAHTDSAPRARPPAGPSVVRRPMSEPASTLRVEARLIVVPHAPRAEDRLEASVAHRLLEDRVDLVAQGRRLRERGCRRSGRRRPAPTALMRPGLRRTPRSASTASSTTASTRPSARSVYGMHVVLVGNDHDAEVLLGLLQDVERQRGAQRATRRPARSASVRKRVASASRTVSTSRNS